MCWRRDRLIIKAIERRARTGHGSVVPLPLTEVTEMEDQLIFLSIKDHVLPEEEKRRGTRASWSWRTERGKKCLPVT